MKAQNNIPQVWKSAKQIDSELRELLKETQRENEQLKQERRNEEAKS